MNIKRKGLGFIKPHHIHTASSILHIVDIVKGSFSGVDDNARFVAAMEKVLEQKIKMNKPQVEKLAKEFGITNQNIIKELTELAIVNVARKLAHEPVSVHDRFEKIVELYHSQVNLSHRTSQSILLQQYSTPAPIGYLMGVFCGIDNPNGGWFFEPSAGNGLLTIAGSPSNFRVNEIDYTRLENLKTQNFASLTNNDATKQLAAKNTYHAVLTNPPFGKIDPVEFNGVEIGELDHVMALRALECMKDTGKAAIIIGGHTQYDSEGRIQQGKNRKFISYLYKYYNVEDIIPIDGHKLYSRQGTSFDVRLILISGRKTEPEGFPPLKSEKEIPVSDFEELFNRVLSNYKPQTSNNISDMNLLKFKAKAIAAKLKLMQEDAGLGMPYYPASANPASLEVAVPDSMGFETHQALDRIKQAIGGNIDEYVREKLGYTSKDEMFNALAPEQIDAVGMNIYNIEFLNQALIIGDQTGIGKGRQAAAMIRYAHHRGLKPIFITEKPNLFSDIFRDLRDIGSADLRPYIVNSNEAKTKVKDEDGSVVYEPLDAAEQKRIIDSGKLPSGFDYIMLTYSQISNSEFDKMGVLKALSPKASFIMHLAQNNVLIMDESHNASGDSNTGKVLRDIVLETAGVCFLSATFAKRPDNMPIYAMKTAMSEANMDRDKLVSAIEKGGVALQEVLSSQLVSVGQMLRRERSFEGIEVNYITLTEKEQEHRAISDNITQILRDIIAFQSDYIEKEVKDLDKIASAEQSNVELRKGTSKAGVDSTPYFSKIFQVVNQMLFAIKAESVVERALMRLREGKKPVIAFSSTMGAFIESLSTDFGMSIEEGMKINTDFATVLQKGLDGVLRYSIRDSEGKARHEHFDISQLSDDAQKEYNRIAETIRTTTSGIIISPIDLIKQRLEDEGYTVAEVTGRKYEVQLHEVEQELKQVAGLGKAGAQRDFQKGDTVIQISTQNIGVIESAVRYGFIIPGQDNSKNYRYQYSVEITDDVLGKSFTKTINEEDLKLFDKNSPNIQLQTSNSKPQTRKTFGLIKPRKKENVFDAFNRFNNNEVDVLMINQSGSTGASAHAVVTNKVPLSEVKQRVMIVLQAELDINREVQKRGRVNRTGQVMKPIYDYMSSAIPAEKRLMMMLQKKLKSLDANTTSNQANSEDLLKSDDFLNKYGDKVVAEFLKENLDINTAIDDPLGMEESGSDNGMKNEKLVNLASKASGRIAVLETKDQDRFYSDIITRYDKFVNLLKAQDEYDLEVETMNLQAKTLDKKEVIVGKGGTSPFGDNTILERCEINILKKPYSIIEMENLLKAELGEKFSNEYMNSLKSKLNEHYQSQTKQELADNEVSYQNKIDNIPNEKDYQKAVDKDAYLQRRTSELNEAKALSNHKIQETNGNKKRTIQEFFDYFHPGKMLYYPNDLENAGLSKTLACFIGFDVDFNRKNPFAPSAIDAKIAIASSKKYIPYPLSRNQELNAIIGTSRFINTDWTGSGKTQWENAIKENTKDRGVRYILTGNLLQAFSWNEISKPKLISFTTSDNKTRKGIILPDTWTGKKENGDSALVYTTVPVAKALKVIKSMGENAMINSDSGVYFGKEGNDYILNTPRSRKAAGDIYLDAEILDLVEGNNFNSVSDRMKAIIPAKNLDKVCQLLQKNHSLSVRLLGWQMDLIKNEVYENQFSDEVAVIETVRRDETIVQPAAAQTENKLLLYKYKAKAIAIKMRMLSSSNSEKPTPIESETAKTKSKKNPLEGEFKNK